MKTTILYILAIASMLAALWALTIEESGKYKDIGLLCLIFSIYFGIKIRKLLDTKK